MRCSESFFGRIGKALVLWFFLAVLPLSAEPVAPADRDLEPWLLLEKGKGFFREREFSTAMNYFFHALEEGAVYPEVEYWMGRVYEEEGEFLLAEEQYKKAFELKKYLYIHDDQYEIAYRLARLYYNRQRWQEYEAILLSMIEEERFSGPEILEQEHNLIRVLIEEGLDDLLYLYRKEFTYSLPALVELGEYYYLQGNYRSAVLYNLYAVLSQVSTAVDGILDIEPDFQYPRDLDQLREWDPQALAEDLERRIQEYKDFYFDRGELSYEILDPQVAIERGLMDLEEAGRTYRFSGLLYLLEKIRLRPVIGQFLQEKQFYRSLYYLASSLYAQGYQDKAIQLWYVLAEWPEAGNWGQKAEAQLLDPSLQDEHIIFLQE